MADKLLLPLLAALALLVGCGGSDDTGGDNTGGGDRPGNPAVYQRIDSMKSCAKLQREFDTAMDNVERYPGGDPKREVPMAYADAAMNRMEVVGCP